MNLKEQFVEQPHLKYKFKIGNLVATGILGFVAGSFVAGVFLVPALFICRSQL